jgi:hypothetical protein
MAFNNWQQMLKKTWQTNGFSGTYLKGVASFIKKEKAIMINIGSVLWSPLGVLFKTTSFCFLDANLTVVGGELLINIYPLPLVNDEFATEEIYNHEKVQRIVEQEIAHVTTGTLLMPLVGWDVTHLVGQALTPHMSYIDFPIPPPSHACVEKGIPMDTLLFCKQLFLPAGNLRGRHLTSAEYNELILDQEDLSDLRVFGDYLKTLHDWNQELELNVFEEDFNTSSPHLPDRIPQNSSNERAFISEMSSCTHEIDNAVKLQSQLVKHLYLYSDKDNKYVHLPIVGRDETCMEGMLLTNAALLEYLGLLTKAEKGRYNLGPNAKKRMFFCMAMHFTLIFTTNCMTQYCAK